ncbi:GNAT family N-acetyltransferase [Salipaludibacillus keqinensis]|uniref:GNAT family N-acetyltransferase n=1 Tax=Salipaludibacillus keqinensis TaxID=2045207 RepID=A0A323TIY1_9BACI|nr:GNAT family protein [Salipaludibacillus keqinensis]PYZ93934.1 GNAT family N-acetyltransferase [Salipaludibacillus keqinensis]
MIRKVQEEDLLRLWELTRKEKDPEWKKWDAPYFEHHTMTYQEYVRNKDAVINRDDYWLIEVEGQVIGTVGYYWEHKPSKWLEMGIGIYDSNFWSGEFGTTALTLWINHLFNELAIVRVGYTTWSGNKQMVRVGEKLGMTMEARMRKCRYYNGEYYDSIRMGLLREEWEGWA